MTTEKDFILRTNAAAELLGVSTMTLWRWSKDPSFPPKIRLGKRAVGFRDSDLQAWIKSREEGAV